MLFLRGYKIQGLDETYIKEKLIELSINPKILENVIVAQVCSVFKDRTSIDKFRRIRKTIYAFQSFKLKKIVGSKLSNHLAVANNFFQHHKQFGTLFLKALRIYKYYDDLHIKPSFATKEKDFLENPPFQDESYNDILTEIFPELFAN